MLSELGAYACESTWIIGTLSVIVLYLINWYRRPNKLPPGPRGLPLVGYLPFLGKSPEKTARKLSEKYGKIMSIRMGPEDAVFLNNFDSINKAFVKQGETLSGRRPFAPLEAVTKGNGILSLDFGNKFKSQRKFGLMTLRGFGVGKKQMESICLEELEYLNEEIRRNNEKAFDISAVLHKAVSNNICNVVFGKRFEYDDKEFGKVLHLFTNSFDDPVTAFVNRCIIFVPTLRRIFPFSYFHKQFLKGAQTVLDFIGNRVEEHEKTFDENNLRDFIDSFIAEMKKGNDSSFTDDQLFHFIGDLFAAGTETTSSTLYWSLLCMLHYPETQKRLREEIMQVLGSSGTISMANKADMPYVNAFIQELYRYRTLAPLGAPHKANADTEVDGYIIPKDTQVFSNLWAVHNDPTLWKDPHKFMPERFLDEQGNFVRSNYVIPFSIGPRHCLGEQLARMEIFIFLVGMVQKFEFLSDPSLDTLPTIEDGSLAFGFTPIPYTIVAKEI